MTCDIRIGTSGFHYKHWKGPFYPSKLPARQMLDYYVRHFDTVELSFLAPRACTKSSGQFSFSFPLNGRLENLLAILPRDVRYAFEFRELSWISEEVLQVLRRFHAAFCIYELAGYHSPLHLTADYTYVRLHGPAAGKYQGSCSDERLQNWASQINVWSRELKAIYIYFDNDQAGYAAGNALALKRMLLSRSKPGTKCGEP